MRPVITMILAFFFGAGCIPICLVYYPAMFDAAAKTWGVAGVVAFWIAIFIGLIVFGFLVRLFRGKS